MVDDRDVYKCLCNGKEDGDDETGKMIKKKDDDDDET